METKERACANAPGLSRRNLLKAAPALALLGAVPAAAQTETLVAGLFREWEQVREAYNSYPGDYEDEEAQGLIQRLYGIEDQMSASPSETAEDVCCKIVMVETYGDFCSDRFQALLKEARALVGETA